MDNKHFTIENRIVREVTMQIYKHLQTLKTIIGLLLLPLLLLLLLGSVSPAQAVVTVTYYHTDALGSVVTASDETGNLLWTESYRPYGERQENFISTDEHALFFTGKPHDDDTGLSYFGARYYNPSIGRFMGVDPAGFQDANIHSFNKYAYANNNPYKYVDPDGESALLAVDALLIGLVLITAYSVLQPDMGTPPNLDIGFIPAPIGFGPIFNKEGGKEKKGQTSSEVGTCPSCGENTSNKPGKIGSAHGISVKDTKDKIHGIKNKGKIEGNPDVEVCNSCGEVFPQTEDGKLGDSIGNIGD